MLLLILNLLAILKLMNMIVRAHAFFHTLFLFTLLLSNFGNIPSFFGVLPSSFAHKVFHRRAVELYVGKGKIELRMIYRIPPGEKAVFTRKKFDFNKNGFIDEDELDVLKTHIAFEALRGFTITFQGRKVNMYAVDTEVQMARESNSSLEITIFLTVPIWLAPAPPPPHFKVGLMEEMFEHTHVTLRSDFNVRFVRGKLKPVEGERKWTGTIKRFSPLIIRFHR